MKVYAFFMSKVAFILALILVAAYLSLLIIGNDVVSSFHTSLPDVKANAEVLQIVGETIAIIVAGYWAYSRFIKERGDYPFPKVEHRIEHYNLRNGLVYISVFVTVTNEGRARLDLGKGKIYIRQVVPIPELFGKLLQDSIDKSQDKEIRLGSAKELFIDCGRRLAWDGLGIREWSQLDSKMKKLEPRQTRELQFDFLIEDNVRVIEAISFFEYTKSSWEWTTLYSLIEAKNNKN